MVKLNGSYQTFLLSETIIKYGENVEVDSLSLSGQKFSQMLHFSPYNEDARTSRIEIWFTLPENYGIENTHASLLRNAFASCLKFPTKSLFSVMKDHMGGNF